MGSCRGDGNEGGDKQKGSSLDFTVVLLFME